jgi:N-succinyldiaminopimelate aminotransferase
MNPDLLSLHSYPFEKLAQLKSNLSPKHDLDPIFLSIGEPKHAPPAFVLDTLVQQLTSVSQYPATKGLSELREAMGEWLCKRFNLTAGLLVADKHILPVNGTREALFAFAQVVVDRSSKPLVFLPNPFYQIYEGAALLSGAEPLYLDCHAENNYQPDYEGISDSEWQRCQLLYLCSPNNPTGAVTTKEQFKKLIALADKYNFVIASDECYSEIYTDDDNAPPGLLEVCAEIGRDNFERCIVFHSLSKRSNLPGMRSGFVAGDENIIKQFLLYRTYHGCAMSLPVQQASIAAWKDEQHVIENREHYRDKFLRFAEILKEDWNLQQPEAGFNFWAKTPIDDQQFTQKLYQEMNITVLPGSYLSREVNGHNPGKDHVRMALVAPLTECEKAAHRIKKFLQTL